MKPRVAVATKGRMPQSSNGLRLSQRQDLREALARGRSRRGRRRRHGSIGPLGRKAENSRAGLPPSDNLRIGEAANPGPDEVRMSWNAVTANVTSLKKHWDEIQSWGAEALILQEVRAGPETMEQCAKKGPVVFGEPEEGKPLVAIWVKYGHLARIDVPSLAESMKTRVLVVKWTKGKKEVVYLCSIYGKANGPGKAAEVNEALIAVARLASSQGDVKWLVCGDLNEELKDLQANAWLHQLGWKDLSDENTCVVAHSNNARRIDVCLANRAMLNTLEGIEVDWSTSLPVHAVQRMKWRGGPPQEYNKILQRKHPPECEVGEEMVLTCGKLVVSRNREAWKTALDGANLDVMWRVFLQQVEEFHRLIAPEGQVGWKNEATRIGKKADACETMSHWAVQEQDEHRAISKRKRHWQHLAHLWGKKEVGEQYKALLSKATKDLDSARYQKVEEAHRSGHFGWLINEWRKREDECLDKLRQARTACWKDWVEESWKKNPRRLYKWIREGGYKPTVWPVVETKEGEALTGKAAAVVLADRAWWSIWAKQKSFDSSFFEKLEMDLSGTNKTTITPSLLMWLVKKMPGNKAVGWDGIGFDQMKRWPFQLWELVVQILHEVEKQEKWPQEVQQAIVAMLPKGRTGDPLDYRPVVLLPCIYRLWAKIRAKDLQAELKRQGVCPIAGRSQSAETHGLLASLELEHGRATKQRVGGVALDMAKAYDKLPLRALEEAMSCAKVPSWLRGPMMNMYMARRLIRIQDAAGECEQPCNGLLPGCPAATHWMSLLTHVWVKAVRTIEGGTSIRAWVDDLTAVGRSKPEEVVREAVRQAGRMQEAGLVEVNKIKSAAFAADAKTRRELEEEVKGLGIAAQECVKDLGVVHGTSKEAYAKAKERWRTAIDRLRRIGVLPASAQRRGVFIAGSALTAGAFAVAARPMTKLMVQGMRRWVVHANYKGSSLVSAEMHYLFSAMPIRADPLLISVERSATFFAEVLQGNYWQIEDLEAIQAGGRTAGPVEAYTKSLDRLGIEGVWDNWTRHSARGGVLTLRKPLEATAGERTSFLKKAVQQRDLELVAKKKPHLKLLKWQIDVGRTKSMASKLYKKSDQQAACRSVLFGDVIVNNAAKHWTGGSGMCDCGQKTETILHKWWECPRFFQIRSGLWDRSELGGWEDLPEPTKWYGLATVHPKVQEWRAALKVDQHGEWPTEGIQKWYTDASGMNPKDPQLRVVTWAVVWRGSEGWRSITGRVQGKQTVARGELFAALQVLEHTTGEAIIVTDCKLVSKGWKSITNNGGITKWLEKSQLSDLWRRVAAHVHRRVLVKWVPAHKTKQQFCWEGHEADDWEGNDKADEAAKQEQKGYVVPKELVKLRRQQCKREEAAIKVMTAIQMSSLQARKRARASKAAIKKRTRREPRIEAKGKRKRQLELPTVQNPMQVFWDTRLERQPEDGHHLQLVHGPWKPGLLNKTKAGAYEIPMHCLVCGKSAKTTGQWGALARSSCGQQLAEWETAKHELPGSELECTRCGLKVTPSSRAAARKRNCPVPDKAGLQCQRQWHNWWRSLFDCKLAAVNLCKNSVGEGAEASTEQAVQCSVQQINQNDEEVCRPQDAGVVSQPGSQPLCIEECFQGGCCKQEIGSEGFHIAERMAEASSTRDQLSNKPVVPQERRRQKMKGGGPHEPARQDVAEGSRQDEGAAAGQAGGATGSSSSRSEWAGSLYRFFGHNPDSGFCQPVVTVQNERPNGWGTQKKRRVGSPVPKRMHGSGGSQVHDAERPR
jgi:hypothetical protein